MHIFITGGTGFVGSAVVKELISAGYEVTGLARSEPAAKILTDAGAKIYLGRLEDLEGLSKAVEKADGVIHTAFNHDFSNFKNNCEIDRQVIETIGKALADSDRPFVITSAIGVLKKGSVTEETMPDYGPGGHYKKM
jgi:nucleoside-diphosphate-sugar epimerase